MAEHQAVWGVEIGQAGLKALRLRYAEAAGQVIAVAFDYVPHPKILSQPDAIPDELIRQALDTFLSRNDVQNDLVAISLPGQTALARFIQLPPVESSKVAEIVKYEARQQIPFALEDVIWDYQTLGSGSEEGGYLLEAEVGLFAMKREQVHSHLQPFSERKVEVELIQIAPLALYNFLCYDRLGIRAGSEVEAADDYTVVLDMGADNTTLMISNGKKIWIRNVPIGGNHFTRALTKEMKLTFAKAEHLKCNATRSPDPRAVFQALRPVFNDYVAEIQRSIGYFSSVNRQAKIGRILGVGNGFKLAGLQKFLQQNLQYDVERVESYQALVGDQVLTAQLFQDNIMSFVVPYGLALQGLGLTRVHTTLLPPEIALARKIRRKKPWAVATAATLLFGLATSALGGSYVLGTVSEDRFGQGVSEAESAASQVQTHKSAYSAAEGQNTSLKAEGEKLVGQLETRDYWLEVYRAINACLPRDVGSELDEDELPKKDRISIRSITVKRHADLGEWFKTLTPNAQTYLAEHHKDPPTGEGYVFTLAGVHFHDEGTDGKPETWGMGYVKQQFLDRLQDWKVQVEGTTEIVPVGQIGITHATATETRQIEHIEYYPHGRPGQKSTGLAAIGGIRALRQGQYGEGYDDTAAMMAEAGARPSFSGSIGRGAAGRPQLPSGLAADALAEEPKTVRLKKQEFTIQFAWKPVPKQDRAEQPPYAESEAVAEAPATTTDQAPPAETPAETSTEIDAGAAVPAEAPPAEGNVQ